MCKCITIFLIRNEKKSNIAIFIMILNKKYNKSTISVGYFIDVSKSFRVINKLVTGYYLTEQVAPWIVVTHRFLASFLVTFVYVFCVAIEPSEYEQVQTLSFLQDIKPKNTIVIKNNFFIIF